MRTERFYRHLLVAAALATGIMMAMSAIPAMAQNQPHMEAAMRSLQQARNQLAVAATNKGGHRERAMRLVDQAMNETRAGMAYAQRHPQKNHRQYRSEQQRRYEEQHRREQQRRYEEQHHHGYGPTPQGQRTPYPPGYPQGPGH